MNVDLGFLIVNALHKHKFETGEDLMPFFKQLLREHRRMHDNLQTIQKIMLHKKFPNKAQLEDIYELVSQVSSIQKQ